MKATISHVLVIGAVSAVLACSAAPAKADIVVFDDEYGEGWKDPRNVDIQTEYAHGDSGASLRRTGKGVFVELEESSGLAIDQTPVFRTYVNFVVTDETPGHSITNLRVSTVDGTRFEFDDRSDGWVCYLDGVEYVDAAEVFFDTDPHTWQLFELDMSQVDYYGWPYQSRQLGSTPIESIAFDIYGSTTGRVDMMIDDVRLVSHIPEPASLILFGVGGLTVLLRRRNCTGK